MSNSFATWPTGTPSSVTSLTAANLNGLSNFLLIIKLATMSIGFLQIFTNNLLQLQGCVKKVSIYWDMHSVKGYNEVRSISGNNFGITNAQLQR